MKTKDELGRKCSDWEEFLMDLADDTGLPVGAVAQMMEDVITVAAHSLDRPVSKFRTGFRSRALELRSEIYPGLVKGAVDRDRLHVAAEEIRKSERHQREERNFTKAVRDLSRFADRLSRINP